MSSSQRESAASGAVGSPTGEDLRGAIVDVDVHPRLSAKLGAVLPYMPSEWRRQIAYLADTPLSASPLAFNYLAGAFVVGQNAELGYGQGRGANAAALTDDLVRGHGVGVAHLIATDAAAHSLQARNFELGGALAAGFNGYLLEEWMGDEHLRFALNVFPSDARGAAAEVRRWGDEPRVASVWVPVAERRLGSREFDPIYEAAVEFDLPIVAHPAGARPTMATPAMRLEGRVNLMTHAWSNIASLVANGTLERFPTLKFIFMESGFAWLGVLLERLDAAWRTRGSGLDELRRAPSECVAAQVSLSTSPLDDDRGAGRLAELIEGPGSVLADVLVFASNYSRSESWLARAFDACSAATRQKIFVDNARNVLRLREV